MRDAEGKLRLECDVSDRRLIGLERKIKHHIRRGALNLPASSDIERYSDRYFKSILTEDVVKEAVSMELMPQEISRIFGDGKSEAVEDIGEVESSSGKEAEEAEEAKDSDDVVNDYVENFFEEEDELTAEKDEEGCVF